MITQEKFVEAAKTIHDTSILMTEIFYNGFKTDVPSAIDNLSSTATNLLLSNIFTEEDLDTFTEDDISEKGTLLKTVYDKLWMDESFDKEFFQILYNKYAK